jgi:hypothetical protein
MAANASNPLRIPVKSGFVPVTGKEEFTPVYNVLVNDTKPIWIFCGQTTHCQKGMAMVINQPANSPNTIEKYIENAAGMPPAGGAAAPPPTQTSAVVQPPPFAPPPPAAETNTFTFGGGQPPAPPVATQSAPPQAPPAPPAPPAPAVNTVPSPFGGASSVGVQPATFTGAASPLHAREASSLAGVIFGAALALL